MGMIGNLFRLTAEDLELILKDSSLLEEKVYTLGDKYKDDLLDIDKTWEAIFYLLTGHPVAEMEDAKVPLSWVLFSGQMVDEGQDMGYGPTQYLTAVQVKQLNLALDKITREDIKAKYDGKKMNDLGIYPEVWDQPESLEYVLDYFDQLKDFYKIAESENKCVITYIS